MRYILTALLVLLAPAAMQAIMAEQDFEVLVRSSEVIAVGTVVDVRSEFNQARSTIYTISSVGVSEVIAGDVGSIPLIQIRTQGGEAGATTIVDKSAPRFELGEAVALFLTSVGDVYEVPDGFEGKFTITEGIVDRTGEPLEEFILRIEDLLAP